MMGLEFTVLPRKQDFGALLATGVFLTYFALQFVGGYLTSLFLEIPFSLEELSSGTADISDAESASRTILQRSIGLIVGLSFLSLTVMYYSYDWKIHRFSPDFGFVRTGIKTNIFSFVTGFSLNLFFAVVIQGRFPFHGEGGNSVLDAVIQVPDWVRYLYLTNLVVFAAINEEILFRGILYRGFSQSFGRYASALFITTIFVLVHFDTIQLGYWVGTLTLVVISICFLAIREISGSLLPGIFMHAGANSIFLIPILSAI